MCILTFCAINYFLFELIRDWFPGVLKLNYFLWFLNNGPLITIAFAIIGAIWDDININTNLIKTYPPLYIARCLRLISIFYNVTGYLIKDTGDYLIDSGKKIEKEIEDKKLPADKIINDLKRRSASRGSIFLFDTQIVLIINLLIVLIVTLWCLFVAPLMYFVNILAGAPSRMGPFLQTTRLVIFKNEKNENSLELKQIEYSKEIPDNATEASFTRNPVTTTATLAAGIIWILQVLFERFFI